MIYLSFIVTTNLMNSIICVYSYMHRDAKAVNQLILFFSVLIRGQKRSFYVFCVNKAPRLSMRNDIWMVVIYRVFHNNC